MKIGIVGKSRYIDADILMEQVTKKKPEVAKVRYTEGFNDAIMRVRSMIHSAPAADVVEVKHGYWIVCGTFDDFLKCSLCESDKYPIMQAINHKYCPDCGAKMDGERNIK